MPLDRDVAAFDARARAYEDGWLGRLHLSVADRAAELALTLVPMPGHVLDVGCGTGYLLRVLAARCQDTIEFVGVDPAPTMVEIATSKTDDDRVTFTAASAEDLPYPDESFDLVVSTTSFDHWADQRAGLAECVRVMRAGAYLVLVDLFSTLLLPTLLIGRQGKARTKARTGRLLAEVGLRSPQWHDIYPLIKAVTATR